MPSHGQLGQLQGQAEGPGRHDPRTKGGVGEGTPTKVQKEHKNGNMKIGKLQWRPGNSGGIGPGPSGAVVHACT